VETLLARYRNITALAVAIFAQLLLLGYQIRNERDVRIIRVWGVTAITPVAKALHGGQELVTGLWNRYVWLYGAQARSERLRAELDRLKLENQSLRNALETADRLKILASYQQQIPSKTVVSSVIGAGANPNSRVVFLDKGSHDGIRPGMAVITPDGIVGKIQSVFPTSSLLLLISDSYSAVGVLLDKTRVHGVMKGTGLHEARIDYVPNEEKVAVDERVYTSGEDRVFPKGLLVGTVSSAQPGRDFQNITVRPGARLNRLEEVLVVTEGVHQSLPDTIPRPQAPHTLLPPPPPEIRDAFLDGKPPAAPAEGEGEAAAASPTGPSAAAPATTAGPDGAAAQTDADRLKKRYRELGAAQGHVFGEGAPGSKPPDFNLGWTPPHRPASEPPKTPPPRQP
jgi:rod shape-determining protein MreC